MLQKLNTKRGGFTLVEIMIVVAIIALLAAIAVPNFLRSRKRSQATVTLELLRNLDAAKDLYAIEHNKVGASSGAGVVPTSLDLAPYAKAGTPLALQLASGTEPRDVLGNPIAINAIDLQPQITNATFNALSDVAPASFWSPYDSY
jgi:prepilin-type N-terminal cleavage/methylation domain-containing protein